MSNKVDLMSVLKNQFNSLSTEKKEAIQNWLKWAWVGAIVGILLPFVSMTTGAIVWVAWTIPQLRKTAKEFWNWIVKQKK